MKQLQGLEKRIRGWFPQETKMPLQSNTIRSPRVHKSLPKSVSGFLTYASMYILALSLLFAFSTLQAVLVASTAIVGSFWFIVKRTSYKRTSVFLKKTAICLLTLVLVFASFQFFVFETSGFPATMAPQISYPSLLDASLTEYLQNVEKSDFPSATIEPPKLGNF
jgi:hypothetical protein